jgi:hypothetical protein
VSPAHQAVARSDLNMLVGPGGHERTEVEFRNLLDAAGFRPAEVFATTTEFSVIESTAN